MNSVHPIRHISVKPSGLIPDVAEDYFAIGEVFHGFRDIVKMGFNELSEFSG